eukprot:TRINITY_DN1102_c0_g1_i5.p1 TRINITY_DN1102_c0_g1~~TRINITY_DN1102_c0_g1_i5.p1  ORF type:complete len:126 (+),score=34.27 TRINITY_DN1102_c0_g1_i5:38-415(+)
MLRVLLVALCAAVVASAPANYDSVVPESEFVETVDLSSVVNDVAAKFCPAFSKGVTTAGSDACKSAVKGLKNKLVSEVKAAVGQSAPEVAAVLQAIDGKVGTEIDGKVDSPVSYTHLTLPTKRIV